MRKNDVQSNLVQDSNNEELKGIEVLPDIMTDDIEGGGNFTCTCTNSGCSC